MAPAAVTSGTGRTQNGETNNAIRRTNSILFYLLFRRLDTPCSLQLLLRGWSAQLVGYLLLGHDYGQRREEEEPRQGPITSIIRQLQATVVVINVAAAAVWEWKLQWRRRVRQHKS